MNIYVLLKIKEVEMCYIGVQFLARSYCQYYSIDPKDGFLWPNLAINSKCMSSKDGILWSMAKLAHKFKMHTIVWYTGEAFKSEHY